MHAEAVWQALLIPTEPIAEGLEAAQQQNKGTIEISAISSCVFSWISITSISINLLSYIFPISEFGKQAHSLKQYLAIDENVLGKQVKETRLAIHRTICAQIEEYYGLAAALSEDQAQPLILG